MFTIKNNLYIDAHTRTNIYFYTYIGKNIVLQTDALLIIVHNNSYYATKYVAT